MKTTIKRILGLSLVTAGILSLSAPTSAEAEPVQTDGKASFMPQTGAINTIKPGTDEKIEVEGGEGNRVTVENIQLMHVPNFDFGKNETSVDTKNYDAIYERYNKAGDATKYAIPHFVQVGDVSGVQGTAWAVTVEQEALFKENGGHLLKASRVNLYNQTLTNNVQTGNVADVVTGLTIPSEGSVQVPVKGVDTTGSVAVLTSKAGKTDQTTTNGTISSVVFRKDYEESNYGKVDSPAVTDKNTDVKLNVPQSDGVQATAYGAKLNWTLTVGP
ncbi:hypothetical protein ATZ33_14475 [Enterococcus silesiacus]|uniref:WxL domain-containing protein n=1 Tax=Enterococcus silesiacus TaxID=332949 RepID=A0A0S3KE16_9ENTE|nr:WxL domain-containing protein [Enterococcus silesiacus]ALS02539.1 hypothetical protein ATZ33_14475 [Enterococcus silesiacus]OJG93545.1 hypothetical protein RV15_GL000147 [Enterococcus silesiacus]